MRRSLVISHRDVIYMTAPLTLKCKKSGCWWGPAHNYEGLKMRPWISQYTLITSWLRYTEHLIHMRWHISWEMKSKVSWLQKKFWCLFERCFSCTANVFLNQKLSDDNAGLCCIIWSDPSNASKMLFKFLTILSIIFLDFPHPFYNIQSPDDVTIDWRW